ncbi:MAG: T9SS type A sorting domain-containing protein [Bacteroidia bacterium]
MKFGKYCKKKLFLLLQLLNIVVVVFAQDGFSYKTTKLKTPLGASVIFNNEDDLPPARIIHLQAEPNPISNKINLKQQLTIKHLDKINNYQSQQYTLNKKAATAPLVLLAFNANFTQGTPNDNDLAVSNNGLIASCVNTNINFYNDSGRLVWGRLLSAISNRLGPLNRTYDPRVIYDPIADRFILVFLQGSTSQDTRIIVCFTKTNDPSNGWNMYQIPGNITGDSSWSDYPIISINKEDLFITVNRLKDNTSWQDGFIESYIWQVNKSDGYNGDSLRQIVYNNIKFNDRAIWSICPTKFSFDFDRNEMFFLSVRPNDLANDTIFLHRISNSLSSGNAVFNSRILKLPVQYGLQPNALMPNKRYLQTNDARVLSAMDIKGMIYFVGNCIDTALTAPGIMFGVIGNTWTNNPTLRAQIISYDTLDIGYPSIAYAGSGANGDHSCMITFSHSSTTHFPGTSVVYVDRNFNISPPVFVKQGEGNINRLLDSVQRWGDYTGIQRKYNENGILYLSGSYGTTSGDNRTVIGKVLVTDPLLSIKKTETKSDSKLFPNPVINVANVEFTLTRKEIITVELGSLDGKYLKTILVDRGKPGLNQLTIETTELPNGMYFVNLKTNEGIFKTHRFIVNH